MDKDVLKEQIYKETMDTVESILRYASVAVEPNRYPQFRSAVLRVGNDCWRSLHEWLDCEEY